MRIPESGSFRAGLPARVRRTAVGGLEEVVDTVALLNQGPRNTPGTSWLTNRASDSPTKRILTQLGSAVLLCWDDLPAKAQLKILDQANDMIGITPIPDIRSRIVELLWRRNRM